MSKYRNAKQWRQYKKICAEIWQEREGKCEYCGRYIPNPRKHNFHHTAGRTINLLNKDTIMLVCFVHHQHLEGIAEKNGQWLDNP